MARLPFATRKSSPQTLAGRPLVPLISPPEQLTPHLTAQIVPESSSTKHPELTIHLTITLIIPPIPDSPGHNRSWETKRLTWTWNVIWWHLPMWPLHTRNADWASCRVTEVKPGSTIFFRPWIQRQILTCTHLEPNYTTW